MLINGQKVNVPFSMEFKIPRPDEDIIFTAKAVSVEEEYRAKCKQPEPPVTVDIKTKAKTFEYDDRGFKEAYRDWSYKSVDLQVLRSLEGIIWESVDMEDSNTWKNWRKECADAGFSQQEIGTIIRKVTEAQEPSPELIKEIRESFLAGKGQTGPAQSDD